MQAYDATLGLLAAESIYLNQIVHILRQQLTTQLIGVYLFGSASSGSYDPGLSDLDVQAVVTTPLDHAVYRQIASHLAHRVLPCPARRLEFVLYSQAAILPATQRPQFAMNFNTGSDIADHLTLDPAQEASHWFLLDIAMGRAFGRTLFGPEATQVFAPIPRVWQLEAILDSLTWHQAHESASVNGVLNACRGWRYAVTDTLGSKQAGAAWAQQQPGCPPVVTQALAQRQSGTPLNAADVTALIAIIAEAVQAVLQREQGNKE